MRLIRHSYGFRISYAAAGALALLALPPLSAGQTSAQQTSSSRSAKDFVSTGQLNVEIQDATGAAFFQGANVALLTRNIEEKLSTTSDPNGRARFTALPVGQYLVEITAPGYRTVRQQVIISGTNKNQSIVVSMLASMTSANAKGGSASAPSKAVKETEKGLHALQLNRLDEAQQHLSQGLAIDPEFADGNYLMGVLLLRQKQPAKAAAYLQKSLTLSPKHSPVLLALGEAQYLEHDYLRATASLEQFLREEPGDPQATLAQKYVDGMRHRLQAASVPDATGPAPQSAPSSNSKASGSAELADLDLPSLSGAVPVTETNWAPADVDAEKLDVDSSAACDLNQVIGSAGSRIQELVQNVDRFTATEEVDHSNLSPMGLQTSRETRKFDYLVEIHQVGANDLNVEEYRDGSVATQAFPAHIATMGLPTLVLVLHPYFQSRYEYQCEGRGTWRGKTAWLVHFRQRDGQSSGMLTYHVGSRFLSVGLKGRAWIDAKTSQVLAMESDIVHPIPDIRLFRDHQLVEYGPVSFRKKSVDLWLPKSADWYCAMSGRRFHRRHTFSNFLLFAVDDKEKVSTPPADKPDGPQ